MDPIKRISQELNISSPQVSSTVELLDSGNTIPFISRYRKEVTGGLDEEQIRNIAAVLDKIRALDERRATVMKSIQGQGLLTEELKAQILAIQTRTELEDIYQPFKPKRKTRASVARQKGLKPLADYILEQKITQASLEKLAQPYLSEEVSTPYDAWSGARDIVAEIISDHANVRGLTRDKALQWATITTQKIDGSNDSRSVFQDYYVFSLGINRLRPHQILAINRGETEKILNVKLVIPERDWRFAINQNFPPDHRSPLASELNLAAEDSAERLLLPAIERDVRRILTEQAEKHAIQVFADNLRNLLNQPPLVGHTILGIDPGFRTGCKVAVIDQTGKNFDTATIYPHPPQNLVDQAKKILASLIKDYQVTLIAIGNGTASRETEIVVSDLITNLDSRNLHYLIVNEAGASVYSASALARTELPDLDVSMRGAVSIARRVQDPLAELIKIDPKSIGVGMYQHDVDQKELTQAIDGVVESVVNRIGVDVNTASPALLGHVAGIGASLATRIVEHRSKNGPFRSRQSLKDVSGFGPKAFEQSAGFLRIRDGENPLDGSAIHPESYPIAEKVIQLAAFEIDSPPEKREAALSALRVKNTMAELAEELKTGVPTLEDIFEQLVRPGRDPREDVPAPILRSDVLKMEDLIVGMRLKGTVRNVVDFGAFIDIGVKQDGLLHHTQIPKGTNLSVGDVIEVEIFKVEMERGRISLGCQQNP